MATPNAVREAVKDTLLSKGFKAGNIGKKAGAEDAALSLALSWRIGADTCKLADMMSPSTFRDVPIPCPDGSEVRSMLESARETRKNNL